MRDLEGRGAVVTGAAGNLGKAVVRELTTRGVRVLGVAHEEGDLERIVCSVASQGECRTVVADISTEDGVAKVTQAAAEFPGKVELLVNLAGGFRSDGELWETSPATWDRMMGMNARSVFLMCRAFIPGMLKHGFGRIVNVSSKAGVAIRGGSSAYTVSKAAVATLTTVLREELKGTGVTAVALAPSVINTPAARDSWPSTDPDKWVEPEELARAIAYLCSKDGGLFSGGTLPAYGAM